VPAFRSPGRGDPARPDARVDTRSAASEHGSGRSSWHEPLPPSYRPRNHRSHAQTPARPQFHPRHRATQWRISFSLGTCAGPGHLSPSPDENPPGQDNPVAPARRSAAAQAKASAQHDPAGQPYRSFRALLDHLATLTRNQVRFAGTRATVPMLTEPTSTQRHAFDLIGAPIPLTLT
jgi:hypothetical protein